ncbi:MAG TPA: DUF2232 domain-containing protein, partial [Bacillales bacterium]|nr:DUF2232 domain-containing protein [Bacillales bacterium]
MKQTNVLIEGALTAALFAFFLGITIYVPILSLVSVWLLPLPLVVYAVRNGMKPTLLLWAVIFAVSLLIGGDYGLILAFVYAGGGLVVGVLYHQRRSAFTVLFGGSLAFTAGVIVIFI